MIKEFIKELQEQFESDWEIITDLKKEMKGDLRWID